MNESTSLSSMDQSEGVIGSGESLNLDLNEELVNRVIANRIEDGKAFYDGKLNLTKVREDNEKRWMGKNREVAGQRNYDYQVPYEDNRIFVSVETLAASLVPRIPTPEVTAAQDTNASRELAENYEKVLQRTAEDEMMKPKLRMIVRHILMGYRCGVAKMSWDFDKGTRGENDIPLGGVKMDFVRPHKIVVDKDATDPFDIPLIAENITCSLEDLIRKFPDKKDKILSRYSNEKIDLGKPISYWEVWFTYFDSKGKKSEGIAWKMQDMILGYGKNPYFKYDGNNFFDSPVKPYVFFNFLRIGRWVFDDTSLTEQAAPLQDILNKRGHQIVDNADQANTAKVFNTEMIDAKDAEKYTGDPNDNILVAGDVRTAFARVPAPNLPSYVLQDKYDARSEIDNVFGTHAPIRGEKSSSPTLGQEVISQRADLSRTASLSEAIEEGSTRVYQIMTQLYKVFAKKEHIIKHTGEDGHIAFIKFSNDKIEDGVEIRVRAGSLEPEDKTTDRNEAVDLAKTGKIIDPLTFAEKWHVDKPIEAAKRSFYFMFAPDKYATEILKIGQPEGTDEALKTIGKINAGEFVPGKKDATPQYLQAYGQFVQAPEFKQLDPEVQRMHVIHLRETSDIVKENMKEGPSSVGEDENVLSKIVKRITKK